MAGPMAPPLPRPDVGGLAARPVIYATLRLAIVAGCVSATKVALFAIGSSAFLATYGAAGLPWFYIALAILAASASLVLAPLLERGCPVIGMLGLLGATAVLVLAVAAGLALGVPGAPAALLLLGHVFNIASEILLWVMAAAWLPVPDLRRGTVWIYLATALGGFAGGVGAERLLVLGPAVACATISLLGSLYAGLWLKRSLALPDRGSARPAFAPEDEDGGGVRDEAGGGWRGLLGHPLGPLLCASSFMLTLVWGMTEYLCFAVYEQRFSDPNALARFLAAIYAVQQLVELVCVAVVTGPATRRMSPVGRTILFPLGSLLSLLAMGRGFDLPATILAHSHTEAVSNGLFDPVHASNFAAVPHRMQARVRSVSEGVCYPMGMAAGALLLLAGPGQEDLTLVLAATVGAASVFLAVALFTGVMVAPALLTELGLSAEIGPPPRRAALRAAARALEPWARRTRLRQRLLVARAGSPRISLIERRVARANRRALAEVFARAKSCHSGSLLPQLEVLLDSRRLELRALVAEAVLSLPVRPLFIAFLPALRTTYLG